MTREEALKWIEALVREMKEETSISNRFPDPEYRDEVYIALDVAIKALQEYEKYFPTPTEECH